MNIGNLTPAVSTPHASLSNLRANLPLLGLLSMLILFSSSTTACAGQIVRLATLNWPPYIGQKLPAEGYTAELIRSAFERRGYQVQFYYMPWGRAVKSALRGHYDGLTPAYFTKKRAEEYSMSIAFPAGSLIFAQRKGANIQYENLSDLRPYKIAVVRGYANTVEFDTASYLHKSYTNEDLTGYRRLLFGRVDLWLADQFVAQYTMSRHKPERAREIEFITKPLCKTSLHIGFSKSKPYCAALTNEFNAGLKQVLNDGTLQKILTRHGLSLN